MDIKNMTTENLWEEYWYYMGELANYERKLNLFGLTEKDEANATRSSLLCYILNKELELRGEL